MTQDEIIELAKHAGYKHPDAVGQCENFAYFNLEAFAKLIAAKEREAWADLIHELAFSPAMFATMDEWRGYKSEVGAYLDAIRARGEA